MKKSIKKILTAGAVAGAMLVMSASAFATATIPTDKITYDATAGKVTVASDVFTGMEGQTTILIFDATKDDTNLTADDILYINQDAAGNVSTFAGMGVRTNKTGDGAIGLADGTYTVKIGGDQLSEILVGTLTVSSTPAGPTYKLGDVNNDDAIDTLDSSAVLQHYVGLELLVGDALLAANANGDTEVDTLDASAILQDYIGLEKIQQN